MASVIEPLLQKNPHRFVLFPIQYPDIWDMFKSHEKTIWHSHEVDLSKDRLDWEKLGASEQHFIKRVLGFFAGSDGIVMENISMNFMSEIQIPEARQFYAVQNFMEAIHSETYALLIDTYVEDRDEKIDILRSIQTVPCIRKKAEWAMKWMNSNDSDLATRLLAFSVVEGIFFSGAFCAIFWIKQRGLMPGLTTSNEFIMRDEGLHTEFACLMYSKCERRLTQDAAHALVREAVSIEEEFINDALPCALIGMNAARMSEYIQFVADRHLMMLGYDKLWNVALPFPWMDRQSLTGKTNFFEKKVAEYTLAGVGQSASEREISFDAEF